ncbi:MAG: acyl-CoA dehydrogenase [Saprospiraceae bacterium]|nr:acyl-CoA dehydrogenase family protein [Bacteroidia bacterium]NNE14452.1 acyl-CoA dehydrogenase [Saprospiraceae bacterium]NNL93033.1 acyl-CoA dehydrogenase [Saprospiraceae bacterium]
MSTTTDIKSTLKGTEFLLNETPQGQTYSSDDITEEHKMIKQTVDEFVNDKVLPIALRIDKQEEGLSSKLMDELGELGILSAHIPESYGGMHMDFISNTLIAEGMGAAGSLSVAYNAHTGIGMLPILYYGTEAQKQKYLPKLGSGEWKASYCLTEPSSGSDALSAKTRADMSEDGQSYILNGQKMWISNAGFANLFIVFAQVDGDKFTGFIVEREREGLTLGAEEDKLGIKGSSTRQVFFENVKIPKENLLGEIGKGHLIAFNVLNIGRYKLGVSCLGGSKRVAQESIKYAKERKQFKQPIANFGAIKFKLAEQKIKNYVLDASIYRLAGLMDNRINELSAEGMIYGDCKLKTAEEFALECSIIKVFGSEVLDYVCDEAVQVHGGMGYSEEGVVARAYRDSRINRIFEGTNEINRLLMLNLLFKKSMKGEFDLASKAMAVQTELMNGISLNDENEDYKFPIERKAIKSFKKVLFMLMGYAGQQAMSKELNLKEAQEPVMNISDIITDIFTAESLLLRVEKSDESEINNAILKTFFYDTAQRVYKNALDATGSIVDESMFGAFISSIKKLTKYPLQNTMKHRRLIADQLIK